MKVIKFNGKQDYSKLNHLPFNRRFTVRTDLVQSMNDFGFIDPIKLIETDIITGRKELFVADGQHRAITAAFLDIEFYGVVIDVVFTTKEALVEFVSNLNSTHKVWTISNYVDSYAYLQKEPYKTLLSYKGKNPYSLHTLATMLYGYRSKNSVTKKIEDGTFVRCKNISLGYTFSENLLKKMYVSALRVYANVTNAFTITKYSGMDPEVGSWDPINAGIDNGFYPQSRRFTFGLNITLSK